MKRSNPFVSHGIRDYYRRDFLSRAAKSHFRSLSDKTESAPLPGGRANWNYERCFMKMSAHIVTLLLFFSVALFAQTSKIPSSPVKHPASAKTDDCAPTHSKSPYYDRVVRLPNTPRKLHLYDVDTPPPVDHQAICLSAKAGDVMVWSSAELFTLKISPSSGNGDCKSHPFKSVLPAHEVFVHYSGPARPKAVGCVYAVEFERLGKKESDPHIRITP